MSTARLGIFLRVFVFMLAGIFLTFNNKKSKKVKKQLQNFDFSDFELLFNNLINHKLESHFVGIASNKLNCVYFFTNKNKINFEYEALNNEQIKYANKLIEYANKKEFEVIKTTYEHKFKQDNYQYAPVYQIISNKEISEFLPIIKEIYTVIFKCDNLTKFELKY